MAELEVIMPRLSDTMEEGLLTRWLKSAGDSVARGDELAEIETDKVTVALEAEGEGFLVETFVAAGTAVAPGTVLGVIGSSLARAAPERKPVRATPLARKLAGRAGLELETLGRGSGPEGRILRHDIERALSQRTDDPVGVTSIQRVTAQRLTRAKQEIPHYYLDADVDMTDLLRLKADLLGTDGVDSFHAIINPPESGILAVGTISARPAVHGGELCVRQIARLSLSADHRIYSGRTAARFLSAIKRRLERPLLLLDTV